MAQSKGNFPSEKGRPKLDARQKFEQGEKDLKLLKRRLFDSRKSETGLKQKLEEITSSRKRLMARQYIDRSKQYEVDLKKANEDFQLVDRRLADSIVISAEISGMLAEKKEEQRKQEIAMNLEGIELEEGELRKVKESYYAKQEEIKVLQAEATKHKRQIGIFLRRNAELEKAVK